jgi:hypothetical protein
VTKSLIRLHTFVRVIVLSRRDVAALVDARRDRETRSLDAARAATAGDATTRVMTTAK